MKILIIIALMLAALITTLVKGQPIYSDITYTPGTNIDIGAGADLCADAININGTYTGSGTICQGPLPGVISYFTSSVIKNNVRLDWATEYEINNSGFRIERMDIKENQWKEIWFVAGHGTSNEPHSYSFEDKKLPVANYKYRLKQIDYNGSYEYYELSNAVTISPPNKFSISQNYPNPFNATTKIRFSIPHTGGAGGGLTKIIIFDILGREVKTILNEQLTPGVYETDFDATDVSSGMYFYRITVTDASAPLSTWFTDIKEDGFDKVDF